MCFRGNAREDLAGRIAGTDWFTALTEAYANECEYALANPININILSAGGDWSLRGPRIRTKFAFVYSYQRAV